MEITEVEARQAAIAHLEAGDIAVEITAMEPCTIGWIVCYESKAWLRSGEECHRFAGNAPLLVERATGRVHSLGTSRPVEWYVSNLMETGSAHTEPGCKVEITGWEVGASVVAAVKAVRASSGLGLLGAKQIIESCLSGEESRVCALNAADAQKLVNSLNDLGFRARQLG